MKYMGSKNKIAKYICPIIQNIIDNNSITCYIEPFVGGSNIIEHINCKCKIGSDNNYYLIEFMKKLQSGWNPLTEVDMTKQLYDDIKNNKDKYPPEIVALAGLCATYNSIWFSGYAGIVHTKTGVIRNYYDEAVRNILKQINNLMDVSYFNMDYRLYYLKNEKVKTSEKFLFYCDPPYAGAAKYHCEFNHTEYWEWVRKMSEKHIVICSEYNAPADFECIWSKEIAITLGRNNGKKSVEKLFLTNIK